VEKEEKYCLPFLDVLTMKKQDGSLAHQVYRKKTHTDRYLHVESHHHPAQKTRIISTLVTCAIRISDKNHLEQEFNHLRRALLNNGYKRKQINEVIQKA
jgi:hypothetical protein